ncbi:XTP/dITP diphosphatase [Natroniella sulfidigena]|uniref:XTP/dITP diphosphatase n=1 Tax=Natroniella sulfidigena TaxID=723921 RepID=UPI00200B0F49|nr:XTP/dITP diphosphatase [Natroniella sulfidigena]MCK8815840.1 XTP/dITP diphosphatase [Natroniella sulfidigena]
MKLFLATGNENKVKEMKEILSDTEIEILSQADIGELPEVVEDATTFTGNALKKARELGQQTQLPTIADDSGLVVKALDGQPGVYSARFAGEDATDEANNQKLLESLAEVPLEERTAYFACAMAFVSPTGEEKVVQGRCEGKIALEPKGEAGFGYDPLFIVDGYERTFAQLGAETKNQVSHRAKALEKMKDFLVDWQVNR